MKLYLVEVYIEETCSKIEQVKKELGINYADMFRAGIKMYLDKLDSDGAIKFSDDDYRKSLESCSNSVSSSENNL